MSATLLHHKLIGKEFGVRDGIPLKAARSVNFHLYRSVPLDLLDKMRMVFTTDQGQFYGTHVFIGSATFNILNVHLIDVENQFVASDEAPYKFPIQVEPGKLINLRSYWIR